MKLTKVLRHQDLQICSLKIGFKTQQVYFKVLPSGAWEQNVILEGELAFATPDHNPLIYYAERFLNSDEECVSLNRLQKGIFEVVPKKNEVRAYASTMAIHKEQP